jgi:RNA polymerase sigma factor (sigma-70 family)
VATVRRGAATPAVGPDSSDAELLHAVASGNTSALGPLYDRYVADIRRLVTRLGIAPDQADDLVHATFIDACEHAGRYDGRGSARPWLFGIAVMHVRRHRRSVARLLARLERWLHDPPGAPAPADPFADVVDAESLRRLSAALERLSERKRVVVILFCVEGLSGDEVAAVLGIPIATVWTRLHHARRELRALLPTEAP